MPSGCTLDELEDLPLVRIHLEEDAGKSAHAADGTRVDFNRCGTPLAPTPTGGTRVVVLATVSRSVADAAASSDAAVSPS